MTVALAATLALAILATTGVVGRLDRLGYDQMAGLVPPAPATPIVIVAIDDPSLAAIGRWPWRRAEHAALLRRLAAARPRAVGYDVLFDEPGSDDRDLAQAMAAVPVVMPMAFEVPGDGGRPFTPELPVPTLRGAAAAIGHAAVAFDADGIVRGVGLLAGGGSARWPHVAERLYRVAFGRDSPPFRRVAGMVLPADRFSIAAPVLIPLPHGRFPTVSFAAVARGEVPPELFRDRIVLVGHTAPGSGDRYAVAGNAGAMPGVELLANATAALIGGRFIRPAGEVAAYAMAAIVLAAFLRALLVLPPRVNLALGLAASVGVVGVAALLMRFGLVWLSPAPTLILIAIAYPLWGWRRLAATSRYMTHELARLDREPDPLHRLAATRVMPPGDPLTVQTTLLNRAIDRVRELSRFLESSLQGLPDPTLVVDPGGVVLIANAAARRLFAPTGASPEGMAISVLLEMLAPGSAGLLATARDDAEFATPDGRVFLARTVRRIADGDGSPGWIWRLSDITAIRLATRQRERALALLTHDMRAPQASILALLESGIPAGEAAARIERHARRTLQLADDFVQLARAENADYRADPIDLRDLVIETADDQWALANRRGIDIVCRHDAGDHLILGDRVLLGRALVNLVNNAVKHSPTGGAVTCILHSPEPRDDAMTIRCDVEDEGPGVPDAMRQAIFDPYRTGEAGQRQNAAGAGLGLAFVAEVIRRHGGTLECANRATGGARFSLWLPAEAGDAQRTAE